MNTKTIVGLAAAVIGAGLILYGVLPRSWWNYSRTRHTWEGPVTATLNIGPSSAEACFGGECKTVSLSELPALLRAQGETAMWQWSGRVAYFGGILAALSLLAAAALTLVRKVRIPKAISPGRVSAGLTGVTLLGAAICFMQKPSNLEVTRGLGFYLTAAGCVLGIVGAALLLYANTDQEMQELARGASLVPGAPGGSVPAASNCSICNSPAQWKADQGRWYCPTCQSFL